MLHDQQIAFQLQYIQAFLPSHFHFSNLNTLDIHFSNQVVWKIDNEVNTAGQIILQSKVVQFYGI